MKRAGVFWEKCLGRLDLIDRLFIRLCLGRLIPMILSVISLWLWQQLQRLEYRREHP
ncbi:MAG: hypothetical protein LBD54_00760 [Puniceicoccales bacterium]|jgi:hypothetical protein|nr:hypothetical protein [Puniceicoccales bacterium]